MVFIEKTYTKRKYSLLGFLGTSHILLKIEKLIRLKYSIFIYSFL